MVSDEIAAVIEEFVRAQNAVSPDDPAFGRDIDLFDSGYIDSVGLVEILAFVTARFEVEIGDDDLLSDDFATINGMAKIICREREHSGRSDDLLGLAPPVAVRG